MQEIVLTLTFSIVMFFFMIYPAMKITEFIDKYYNLPQKLHTALMLFFDIVLSLLVGLFLKL